MAAAAVGTGAAVVVVLTGVAVERAGVEAALAGAVLTGMAAGVSPSFTARGSGIADRSLSALRRLTSDVGACGQRHGVGVAYGCAGTRSTDTSDIQTRVESELTAASCCRLFCKTLV